MRSSFAFSPGDIFSRGPITAGLDKVRQLYASKGYINFTCVPDVTTNETDKTLAITIDLDEGKPFDFGPLVLDGVEPHAGVGKELLNSWESLRGKRYNAFFLEQWFQDNVRDVSPDASLKISPDSKSGLVIVELSFR